MSPTFTLLLSPPPPSALAVAGCWVAAGLLVLLPFPLLTLLSLLLSPSLMLAGLGEGCSVNELVALFLRIANVK